MHTRGNRWVRDQGPTDMSPVPRKRKPRMMRGWGVQKGFDPSRAVPAVIGYRLESGLSPSCSGAALQSMALALGARRGPVAGPGPRGNKE